MTEKAKVANIKLGDIQFEGLLLTSGEYRMGVTQVARLFPDSVTPNNATREVKRILGEDFPLLMIATELNSRKVNTISVPDDLIEVLDYYANKGDETARLYCKALMKEPIERRFDIAFNKKREEDEYNLRTARRMQGKPARASLTEAIQEYQEKHQIKDDWIYKNCTQKLYAKLTGVKSTKKLKEKLNIPIPHNMRDYFSERDLLHIQQIEDYAARLILMKDYEPLYAMEVAIDLLLLTDSGLTRSGRL